MRHRSLMIRLVDVAHVDLMIAAEPTVGASYS